MDNNVVIYSRVSTEEQVELGYSLANQKKELEEYCEKENLNIIDYKTDEGKSGTSMDGRDGLKEALAYIMEGKAKGLVVWKLSRLSRNIRISSEIIEEIKENEGFIISVKDSIDTRKGGAAEMLIYIQTIVSQMEHENILLQVKSGMRQKARTGEWNGGKPPLGYDVKEKKLCINEDEAEVVNLIYVEYLKGNGYKAIATILNEQGYKTKKNKPFNINSIKIILRNPVYKGDIRWGLRSGWSKKKGKKEFSDDAIVTEGSHVGIIEREVFDKVQRMIENNPRHHVNRFDAKHPLSGLLRCPHCGYGMSIQRVTRRGKLYEYYICNQYINYKTCSSTSIPKYGIEEELFNLLTNIVNEKSFKTIMLESLKNIGQDIQKLRKIIERKQEDIKKLNNEIDNLMEKMVLAETKALSEMMMKKANERSSMVEVIRKEIEVKEDEIKEIESKNIDVDYVVELLNNVGKIIKLLDRDKQKNLLRKLIKEIQVKDKHIDSICFQFKGCFRVECSGMNRTISK